MNLDPSIIILLIRQNDFISTEVFKDIIAIILARIVKIFNGNYDA